MLRWNKPFVGKISDDDYIAEALKPSAERICLWPHFLAAPLLPFNLSGWEEVKLCGNLDVPANTSIIGCAVDAYVHHTLVDSGGTLLLADIQGD